MKLFEMEGFLCGKCLPADMLANETNAEYLVRKISGLQAQVKQLAAENAALKSAIEFSEPWMPSCDDELLHRIKVAKETPATDAYAASLRAEGVEMLAAIAGNECRRYKSINDRAGLRKWKSIVILCSDFAAQLRRKSEVQS